MQAVVNLAYAFDRINSLSKAKGLSTRADQVLFILPKQTSICDRVQKLSLV